MWRKRDLIIASVVIVALISASVGFYELGLNQGKDLGYQNGFSQGSRSVLIQSFSQFSLPPNGTILINTYPFSTSNVSVEYSFYVVNGPGQNQTVNMIIVGWKNSSSEKFLFSTGYKPNDTGIVNLTKVSAVEIEFRANPNNKAKIDLEFTYPLQIIFN